MNGRRRIYLDNAATSWPKPPSVLEAVTTYLRENGAAAGRGVYASSQEIGRVLTTCRRRVASLLGVSDPTRIVFTFNGTDSLNFAFHGLLRPGDHVVTSDAEHNSVLRPLRFLEQTAGVEVTRVPCDEAGRIDPADIRAALRPRTRLIAVLHASNVTGVIQPLEDISNVAKEYGARLLVDAAQTAGHLPIYADRWGIDLLATSGHKGLLGLLGTGVLALGPGMAAEIRPLRLGGTGTFSEQDEQPTSLPDGFESGNHNVPGLIGLERGTAYIEQRGWDALRRHEQELTSHLVLGLHAIRDIQVYGPAAISERVGLVSFRFQGFDPQELASLLDAEYGIQVRSGLHCAPRMHARLNTARRGGTVRASIGPFSTQEDVDLLLRALEEIAGTLGLA
jgi:cysteine desulfurase / selenocysteine lyase